MTWDELVGCARERLALAEHCTHLVQGVLVKLSDDDRGPDASETLHLLTMLTTILGDLHRACESLTVGLDALMIVVRDLTEEEDAEKEPEDTLPIACNLGTRLYGVKELVGTKITITNIQDEGGAGSNGLFAQIQLDTEIALLFTTQPVICAKLRRWRNQFPRQAMITEEREDGRGQKYFDIE